MKKTVVVIISTVVLLFLAVFLLGEWWIESILGNIINRNANRAYEITYQSLDLHALFKGVTLKSAKITPLNVSDTVTVITGTVDHIELSGIKWRELIFANKAEIGELTLIQPEFEVLLVNRHHQDKKTESSGGFRDLFGDILTRGVVHNFRLERASVIARHKSDSILVASIMNYNLLATEIQTDSVQAKNMIPFKVGSIHSTLDSAFYQINEYTELRSGRFEYNALNSELRLNDISLRFTRDLIEVSDLVGEQVDLIQVEVKQLLFSQLDAHSSLYHDLDIRAGTVEIDGLVLRDFRDKNKLRPPDIEKPMFNGMVGSIPIPIKVDSIIIKDSDIHYTELPLNSTETGTISFTAVNGTIVNVTNIPLIQEQFQTFTVSVQANLNRDARISMNLDVPYQAERFKLHGLIEKFDIPILSSTLVPLTGVEIGSGTAHKFDLKMNAGRTESSNTLAFDYQDFSLEIIKEDQEDGKKGLLSLIANSAIRQKNMPDENHYQVPEYRSFRNIYRGPFNFMWGTIMDGMLYIFPTGITKILMGDPGKKAEKPQEKEKK